MKKILLLLALFPLTAFAQQDEVYMENQAGGYLALTHDECKVDGLKEIFPYHAYAVDGENNLIAQACYEMPYFPNQEEMNQVPDGMSIIPIVNVIDLVNGEIHTLEASLFTSTKPGSL